MPCGKEFGRGLCLHRLRDRGPMDYSNLSPSYPEARRLSTVLIHSGHQFSKQGCLDLSRHIDTGEVRSFLQAELLIAERELELQSRTLSTTMQEPAGIVLDVFSRCHLLNEDPFPIQPLNFIMIMREFRRAFASFPYKYSFSFPMVSSFSKFLPILESCGSLCSLSPKRGVGLPNPKP